MITKFSEETASLIVEKINKALVTRFGFAKTFAWHRPAIAGNGFGCDSSHFDMLPLHTNCKLRVSCNVINDGSVLGFVSIAYDNIDGSSNGNHIFNFSSHLFGTDEEQTLGNVTIKFTI